MADIGGMDWMWGLQRPLVLFTTSCLDHKTNDYSSSIKRKCFNIFYPWSLCVAFVLPIFVTVLPCSNCHRAVSWLRSKVVRAFGFTYRGPFIFSCSWDVLLNPIGGRVRKYPLHLLPVTCYFVDALSLLTTLPLLEAMPRCLLPWSQLWAGQPHIYKNLFTFWFSSITGPSHCRPSEAFDFEGPCLESVLRKCRRCTIPHYRQTFRWVIGALESANLCHVRHCIWNSACVEYWNPRLCAKIRSIWMLNTSFPCSFIPRKYFMISNAWQSQKCAFNHFWFPKTEFLSVEFWSRHKFWVPAFERVLYRVLCWFGQLQTPTKTNRFIARNHGKLPQIRDKLGVPAKSGVYRILDEPLVHHFEERLDFRLLVWTGVFPICLWTDFPKPNRRLTRESPRDH